MKRILVWAVAAVLLLSLVSCKQKLEDSPYADGDFDTTGDVVLSVEYPVYDKSVTAFNYSITNNTEETVTFGQAFAVEALLDGVWKSLPVLDGVGWESIGYLVEPGDTWSNSFSFWLYDYEVADGTYRLIKSVTVGETERFLCREFTIGESGITGDTPYGYEDLEDLPAEIDLETFACDLATDAVGEIKAGSQEQVAAFFEKVAMGTPSMMRLVSITREGDPILYDVIYENDHFLYRVDRSRDRYADQDGQTAEIYQQRYSYLVTDGEYIYLSDYASLEFQNSKTRHLEAGSNVILCLENFEGGEDLAAAVEEMTEERLAGNRTMARYWSEDGTYWVGLTEEKNSFSVSSKSFGEVRTLPETAGEDAEIYSAQWLTADRVQLLFTSDESGGMYRAVYDKSQGKIVFIEAQS